MPEKSQAIGVLLMAYGSPADLTEMEDYLLDIREGRAVSLELVEEIKGRYEQIGGKSPLLERTQEQAKALEEELNTRHANSPESFLTFVGMRHWKPRIHVAVEEMAKVGIRNAVALVMAPHSSRMSTGKYFQVLAEAPSARDIEFVRVESWHKHKGLLDAISEKMHVALEQFEDSIPYIIFTAHSLPTKILESGDPYDQQLRETAGLLAERFALPRNGWQFCYQSAGANAIPWLGPQIEEVVEDLAQRGHLNQLVVPIGFVCDHVEVLYDIDIEARRIAESFGARLERTNSLNASPTFINALADLVEVHLARSDATI